MAIDLVDHPALVPYAARYKSVNEGGGLPLRVVAELADNTPLVTYDPVHLDNLLAWAVQWEATDGQNVPPVPGAYRQSIPLRCLWRDESGLPLWAASCFFAAGDSVRDTHYLHKRAISGEWSQGKNGKLAINTAKGRHMERRVPLPVTVCRFWAAQAWGDPAEVLRLLCSHVSFLGKRRSAGFGEVRQWHVIPHVMEEPADVLVWDGKLTRPVPDAAASALGITLDEPPSLAGWTPPHWKPGLFAAGYGVGTSLSFVVKAGGGPPSPCA